ncbi:MAG: hypothetical protein CMP59_12130 [Flavobacteriales bacterium]|nr:hypothetical protein [Flavobacteriales bacterium]
MAISIGLLGSLHCVGMCGPIALALPLDRSSQWKVFGGNAVYSLGRLSSYFLLGLLFGLLGSGFQLFGIQQYLSIIIGVGIILGVLLHKNYFKLKLPSFYLSFVNGIKTALAKAFQRKSMMNLMSIGFINGFLPCGLVYMAIAGSVSMASPLEGGFFMMLFGLGTLPLMWAVAIFGSRLSQLYSRRIKQLIPVFLLLLGVLFILRGANLGIPYISPLVVENTNNLNCH